jgi:hypothetical protein
MKPYSRDNKPYSPSIGYLIPLQVQPSTFNHLPHSSPTFFIFLKQF